VDSKRPSFARSARALRSSVIACALAALALPALAQTDPLALRDGYHIILYDRSGNVMTWEQFQGYTGRLRWELQSDKPVDTRALDLLESGRDAAMSGDYEGALDLFEEARRNAPFWEYPLYETAWACMLSGDAESAEEYFGRVNAMAPHGFFNSQQAAACLRLEREGKVARGTYQRIVRLDRASRETALMVARDILDQWPDYAAGWERLAFFSKDEKEALGAVTRGLAADPDPFTRDSLRMRRALVTGSQGRTADAVKMLEQLLKEPDLSLSIEAQIRIALPGLRRSLAEGKKGGRG
jgi:tetratricopeptide (TPR) repeat protein